MVFEKCRGSNQGVIANKAAWRRSGAGVVETVGGSRVLCAWGQATRRYQGREPWGLPQQRIKAVIRKWTGRGECKARGILR